MVLFINPIGESITLSVIENGEVRQSSTIPRGRDYDEFPEAVNTLINRHYIDSIWCILGPGAFTRMRIVTLTLNTIALVKNIPLKGCHFFDLIQITKPLLIANNFEYIILSENGPELREKIMIDFSQIYCGYADKNDFTDKKNFIEYREDIAQITTVFSSIPPTNRLSPIYLKEPHITWSKKNTFPSSETMNRS